MNKDEEYKLFLKNIRLDIISFVLDESPKPNEDLFFIIKEKSISLEELKSLPVYHLASDDIKARFSSDIIDNLTPIFLESSSQSVGGKVKVLSMKGEEKPIIPELYMEKPRIEEIADRAA